MASSGHSRGALLDAGGVLSIIAGILELIAGAIVLSIVRQIMMGGPLPVVPHIPWMPGLEIQLVFFPARFIIVGILILVLGAIAIAGGISALSRTSFRLSLAGAICVVPTVLFGILAVIFVAVSKREFGVEAGENGTTSRSRLLAAGGVLSIIGGVIEVIAAGVLLALVSYRGGSWLIIWVVPLLCLGIVAIVGGVYALGRKGYNVSLNGAVCALPTVIFGILAIWFISGREIEFRTRIRYRGD